MPDRHAGAQTNSLSLRKNVLLSSTAMPQYQLQVAIALALSAVCSLGLFVFARPEEGKIQLPTYAEEEESSQQDPFDVTKPEDFIDGTPVDEERFWAKMRLRKLIISLLLVVIISIQSVSLGWFAIEVDRTNLIVHLLFLGFTFYVLAVAVRSVNQQYATHEVSIIHLSVLTFLSSGLLFSTAILPSSALPVVSFNEPSMTPLALWHATLVLYSVCLVIAVTTPRGPPLHFPSDEIYSEKTLMNTTSIYEDNVCGITGASVWDALLFSYTTKVVMLGNTSESLEIGDLPIVPADMRATTIFAGMRDAMRRWKLRIGSWRPKPGSGWELGYRLLRVNIFTIALIVGLAAVAAVLFYAPAYFLRKVVAYLEVDRERKERGWGWVYCAGLFFSNATSQLITGQLWSLSTTTLQVRLRIQLNSILFAKTLVRKDVASSASSAPSSETTAASNDTIEANGKPEEKKTDEDTFSSKAQIMTLMTTDVDRVSEFSWHLFTLIDSPVEIVIGTIFLYHMLGVSCFFGLAVTCLFLPMNHFAGKVVVGAQDNLMKARDERVALMNEILGGIRMLKFMAWERSFETRVHKVRARELKYQKLNYTIEVLWNAIWNGSPILVTLVSFWHFTVIRKQVLTPSIAFTSISVFNEMKFALNALPETLINLLQSLVSMRRIEKYLNGAEVAAVPPLDGQAHPIALQSATITWPQDRSRGTSAAPSVASTPRQKFVLIDLTLDFPLGELSLICGKLGSGKSLLLLGVVVPEEEWIVQGVCAYVPQSAWLRNASIRVSFAAIDFLFRHIIRCAAVDNILFNLPYIEERYQRTLEVCALLSDLRILEDGDMSEIGERGVNLSGGQKARVSLARAVYSRASILLLDDVLSAVDAHTAHHLYYECLKGDLMRGRTLILVSHHVQLCVPGASYIVALDNGRVQFQGDRDSFRASGVLSTLVQSGATDPADDKEETTVPDVEEIAAVETKSSRATTEHDSDTSSTNVATPPESEEKPEQKAPRKLVEEEKRAVGRIGTDIWKAYITACGGYMYWTLFALSLGLAAITPVLENGWLRIWSGSSLEGHQAKSPMYYIGIYAAITTTGLILTTVRFIVLYRPLRSLYW
ncbi:ATP-dependent bile acid permease [Grifola frondosa]|uniref:ATP-dependent bile acid permease n=1 Tax=Grifola frondosa TaxID=5627 RepID=A0A1C7LV88_GRIFR|nr:ATP-dependent bile acid permease [Grifola frondosa]